MIRLSPAHRALRTSRARTDHRHHLDRWFCKHGRMAAIGLSMRNLAARDVPHLGGLACSDRAAVEPVADPARIATGPSFGSGKRELSYQETAQILRVPVP